MALQDAVQNVTMMHVQTMNARTRPAPRSPREDYFEDLRVTRRVALLSFSCCICFFCKCSYVSNFPHVLDLQEWVVLRSHCRGHWFKSSIAHHLARHSYIITYERALFLSIWARQGEGNIKCSTLCPSNTHEHANRHGVRTPSGALRSRHFPVVS